MSAANTYRKIIAESFSTDFRAATRIVTAQLPAELKPTEVLVRNRYVGINASDINFTAGIYQPDVRPPFDCGFEALGEVVAAGAAVRGLAPGDAVVTQRYGAFAEYQAVSQRAAKRVPAALPAYLPLDLSATTASIALGEVLRPQRGETAVVSAAAGGTGQFAAQLLQRVYGCRVAGLCSSDDKARFLTERVGCDAAVNYTAAMAPGGEGLPAAVRRHFPTGANVAYESVGGALFDGVRRSMALKGRVLSIGAIATYRDGSVDAGAAASKSKPLQLELLSHSLTLHTFFLPHYVKHQAAHFKRLCELLDDGTITSFIDPTPFEGLEAVADAVDFLFARRNTGKVVVKL